MNISMLLFVGSLSSRPPRKRKTKKRKARIFGPTKQKNVELARYNKGMKTKLRDLVKEKFVRETLKAHLVSTPLGKKVSEVVEQLPPGVKLKVKQLVEEKMQMHKILPKEGDFDMLEETPTFAEDSKIGLEMGSIYKKAIKLTLGTKTDAQMKTAKELYKGQNWPCFNSDSEKYYKLPDNDDPHTVLTQLRQSAGFNRQGVWFPLPWDKTQSPKNTDRFLNWVGYLNPLQIKMQYYKEIRDYLMSSEIFTWLDEEKNESADVFYAINSLTDTVTYSNGQSYLPVEIKVYICKCKSRTLHPPQANWFLPTGASAYPGHMNSAYVYDSDIITVESPGGNQQDLDIYSEPSVHLGATPFYSPEFRNNWEVLDVQTQIIMPTDKWELTFHREFRHAHSIREMEQAHKTLSKGFFLEGDYALVTTFKGLPCFMKYNGTIGQDDLDTKEVDVSPSRIYMNSRSSMNISAPGLFESSNIPARKDNANYIAGEGRVLDTQLQTESYTGSNWDVSVVTNLKKEEGGAR